MSFDTLQARAVTIKDATRLYAISRTALYRLIAEGKLSKVKIGKRTIIPVEQLERLISPGAPAGDAA